MATQVFSEAELAQLRAFPDTISSEELIRYFTLLSTDIGFIERHRGAANRLGIAVQLCTLPWLGFVPAELTAVPAAALARLSDKLRIGIGELRSYGTREQTRSDHVREVAAYLGWRPLKEREAKELETYLLARAMEHDSPSALFRAACDHLRSGCVIRPGPVWLLERVVAAREAAKAETFHRIEPLLSQALRLDLDGLLRVDPALGSSRLHWLSNGATQASPNVVNAEVEKLEYLRSLDAHALDVSVLPTERRRHLATIGRRSSAQALSRRDEEVRYPILLTLLSQGAVEVLDEVVQLFDQVVSSTESRARVKMTARLAERGRAAEDRLALLEEILPVLVDDGVPAEQVGVVLRERIGMERLRAAHGIKQERLPRDHGHLAALKESYAYLRSCVPTVLKAVRFDGNEQARDLLTAVEVLRELNATGRRKVPEEAPASFVPARWRGYLNQAAENKDSAAFRRYWELSAIVALRDGLRSGDVHVPASRRYADPASYLMGKDAWAQKRTEFCAETGTPREPAEALARAEGELHTALGSLELVLDRGQGPARLGEDGHLVVPKLEADEAPAEAEQLRDELAGMLPRLPLAALLIEVDRRTGLCEHLVHAGGKQARSEQLRRNLLAVLLAHGLNMGLTAMAEASGISYEELAWTAEWYLREETLRAAVAAVVNYHHRLPMTRVWGVGTLSSSDGQRFPMQGKSLTARHLSRYFVDAGISQYTHVSDQHSTYGTKVIVPTHREAHYVLDEILGNQSDLPISEHATDTHGVTLVNFALFDLVGLTLSPRIRDLGRIVLHRLGPRADYTGRYPMAGPLLTGHINTDLITTHYDDMLRLAASFKYGHSTASLLVGKLSASSRQNALAAALKEWGALRRTVYACRYLADEQYQRRIARQLNKGEALHGLRRDLHHVGGPSMRRRRHEQQSEQALCLTLLTNAIICWTTEYFGLAVAELRERGRYVDDAVLAHISPARSEGVNLIGEISIDVDKELAKLDVGGYRPLRRPKNREEAP